METINNLASTAAKAVWGEDQTNGNSYKSSTNEPVSGVQGDTSKGQPYDAGNLDGGATDAAKYNNTSDGNLASGKQAEANKPSSDAPGDSTKAQNDTRHPDEPTTDPKKAEERSNVDDSQGSVDEGDNPVKVEGAGPKPVDELARARGGDAGNVSTESVGGGGKKEEDEEEEDGDGPQKKSHGSGTGEQYVKSSGLKADGGDFDASRPGAGREADRLMEQKGIHNPTDESSKGQTDNAAEPSEGKGKTSLKDKLKAKVHH
ncbi:hypothetical protein NKR23_g2212 [Pleurostoma richardsiae]|uniref:Glycine-rich cell wall structural protein 1 n=1 Tax=Pleurostoma richardsiae TaxID=41990 RepID=A0AA38RQN1_9PEZI|nr:hypothetical protein NKR23_g2212 [Pleurostoma richardsiae]